MAYHTIKSSYSNLSDRLNRFPQGAPPAELLLFRILKILFSEKEAELVSCLPIKPFTAEKASRIWKMDLTNAQKVLDELAGRAILVDIEQNGETVYELPPPMAGFFEFSMMRRLRHFFIYLWFLLPSHLHSREIVATIFLYKIFDWLGEPVGIPA